MTQTCTTWEKYRILSGISNSLSVSFQKTWNSNNTMDSAIIEFGKKKKTNHFKNVNWDRFSTSSKRTINTELKKKSSPPQVKHPGSSSLASRKKLQTSREQMNQNPTWLLHCKQFGIKTELIFKHFSTANFFLKTVLCLSYRKLHPWLNLSPFPAPKAWVMLCSWDAVLKQELSAVLL